MKSILILFALLCFNEFSFAGSTEPFIIKNDAPGAFPLASNRKVSSILLAKNEWPGVVRAAKNLQADIAGVTGLSPELLTDKSAGLTIIVGTIGQSELIDQLIKTNKINVAGIAGKWESTLIEVLKNPLPGIEQALVIAGSDKRGTIYGIYELSYQIGVSPWAYWADVPVKKSESLYVKAGRYTIASPAVKYRGIFLNDEAPALSGWTQKEFGGFNHKFYEKVFELILRLKGNYLWPAMWGNAFNDDDLQNPVLADEYGVVIGTSHHEPLSRAHDEWRRYKGGKWNYDQNPEQLRDFWESGLKRVAGKEQIITVGMRGDGDEPMTEGTATALLERIVKDQRSIIEKVTNKPAAQTPQIWALYKEVQDYYDKGMRVPDDITLLLCDDNWGNIRKLPDLNEAPRSGGYGVYYHFDYVGGPRNYKWINTNPIQKIWEQMNLAHQYDANRIWIVNVGDLKPMEFPIEFFLDYAWAPESIPAEKLKDYTINWVEKQFGALYAPQIASIIDLYTKYNGRRKPELLNENTYSLVNYRELEKVMADFNSLKTQTDYIYGQLPADQKDAFYQLVKHPVDAGANLNALYYAVAKNRLYAKQGRNVTNGLADKIDSLFKSDADISHYYNKVLANGKWDHMMDQTHIGYTSWQQPDKDVKPESHRIETTVSKMGIAIEGSELAWYGKSKVSEKLPVFDYYSNRSHYFEVFNTGQGAIKYTVKLPSYLSVDFSKGEVDRGEAGKGEVSTEQRIFISVDWKNAPVGKSETLVQVSDQHGAKIAIPVVLDNRRFNDKNINAFLPEAGYISMESVQFSKAVDSRPIFWKAIPGYGKTLGGMITVPVTAEPKKLSETTPQLQYDFYLHDAGTFNLNSYVSPTVDFKNKGGLRFAVSVDDEPPMIVNISEDYLTTASWEKSVADNIKIFKTALKIDKPGKHTLKYWSVDNGVVLQKLVIDLGGLKSSFLGPPDTFISRRE